MGTWIGEGIGVSLDDIRRFLSPIKLAEYLEKRQNCLSEVLKRDSTFLQLAHEKPNQAVELIENGLEEDHSIMSIIAQTSISFISLSNDHGRFLLYPAHYPWDYYGEQETLEEVKEHLCDVVLSFCNDDTKRSDIYSLINEDFYEIKAS